MSYAALVPPPHRRLACRSGCLASKAREAGQLEGEELFVDPDVAAVAAFGGVAKAEVEGVAAGVADGGVRVGEEVAADVTTGRGSSAHSFDTSGCAGRVVLDIAVIVA
jgi:hypothetical protein